MNTGQAMITFGAMILLSIVILNMNRSITDGEEFLNETRFGLEKLALATSMIEEISQYPFDEASWDTTKIEKVPSDFTAPADLGPDNGETSEDLYDDVDDYNGLNFTDTTEQNIYKISCSVSYVNPASPNISVGARTLFKKISIQIVTDITDDTTRISYVHGFWYFN
jgi:hypothetical protein